MFGFKDPIVIKSSFLGALLLIWFNFNPNMDK